MHIRAALGLLLLVASLQDATAQTTSGDIIKALTPKPGVRSMRGIFAEQPEQRNVPSIDLYVNFAYDSAELTPDASTTLKALGEALQSPELRGARVAIVGHTDAKGSDQYNMVLSQRRAEAVRTFLVTNMGIETARLEAIGRGKNELKLPQAPEDGLNRRVEVRNVSQ